MPDEIRLTGFNHMLDFSDDAKYMLISSYDGDFKVFDCVRNEICFKNKLKGSKSDIDIRHHGISFDNRFAAFSAFWKIFVFDIMRNESVLEFEYSRAERRANGPFCFFNRSPRLAIPNGDRLTIHDVETGKADQIALPHGAGYTDCIAVNPSDTLIAYKSGNGPYDVRLDRNGKVLSISNNEALDGKIFIYDIATGKCARILSVPYSYIRGMQMSLSENMTFMDDETLLINRKPASFSCFHVKFGKETTLVDWKAKGFEFGQFGKAKIYQNGTLALFNNVTPTPGSVVRNEKGVAIRHSVQVPDGLEWILYSIKNNKTIYRHKSGEFASMALHPGTKQLAYLERRHEKNGRRVDYLCFRKLDAAIG